MQSTCSYISKILLICLRLKPNDSTLIMDLLNMSFNVVGKTGQMSIEAACIFLQKAALLIDSKFDVSIPNLFKFKFNGSIM